MKVTPLASAAFAFCLATGARGQVYGWLDFGGQIPGRSVDEAHRSWIEIQSFGIDGKPPASGPTGFAIFKAPDAGSPGLFGACAAGTLFPVAMIDLNTTVSGVDTRLARLVLENAKVAGVLSSGQTTGNLLERVDLKFARITYTWFVAGNPALVTSYDYPTTTGSSGTGTSTDTDADGMPDAWETTYGLIIGSNDSGGDADGDGLSNLNEYLLGTNPKAGDSFFRAIITPLSGTTDRVTWNSVAGKAYIVEWSPDLATPFAMLRNVTASGSSSQVDVPRSGAVGFYRVRPAP